MKYSINTNQFYKIWFSKNPHLALGIENELALVRLRDKHPNAEISLVYSSVCLSEASLLHLKKFAAQYRIILVNFDGDLENRISDAIVARANLFQDISIPIQDQKLYYLAKKEIQKTKRNQGGNLAAASDITRLLEPVIKLGMYADFDVDLNFSLHQGKSVLCKAPILIQADSDTLMLNNEFFAIAKTSNGDIHPDAQKKLHKLKKAILENYKKPKKALFSTITKGMPSVLMQDGLLFMPIQAFFKSYRKATIFQFRQYAEHLSFSRIFASLPSRASQDVLKEPYTSDLSEGYLTVKVGAYIKQCLKQCRQAIQALTRESQQDDTQLDPTNRGISNLEFGKANLRFYKHIMYNHSVLNITGPVTLKNIVAYSDQIALGPEGIQHDDAYVKVKEQLNDYNVDTFPFTGCVSSPNNIHNIISTQQQAQATLSPAEAILHTVGKCGHQSWTALGTQKKAEREAGMNKAAGTLQNAWRKYKENHATTLSFNPVQAQSKKLKP